MKGFLEKRSGNKWAAVIAASLTIVVLSGFLLSGRSAGVAGGFFGPQVMQEKMESTKQVSLFNKNSKSLTYKETMNQSDLPVSERADKYGTYDVLWTTRILSMCSWRTRICLRLFKDGRFPGNRRQVYFRAGRARDCGRVPYGHTRGGPAGVCI